MSELLLKSKKEETTKGVTVAPTQDQRPLMRETAVDFNNPTPAQIGYLQRTMGNQAIQRAVQRMGIQRKMTLGPVGDKYEQEADAVAKQVVQTINTPKPLTVQRQEDDDELQMKPLQTTADSSISALQRQEEDDELQMKPFQSNLPPFSFLQRQEEEEELQMMPISTLQRQEEEEELQMKPASDLQRQEEEEEELQMKPSSTMGGDDISSDIEGQIQSAKGGGRPLSTQTQSSMGQAFNADFSGVKIHTNGQSDTLNRSLQARAFTTGQDIFFRSGEYSPNSSDGQELLAHELTHTIQQGSETAVQRNTPITENVIQLKRAYRALNSQFHGNNELRVLNKTNYHITVPDPERSLEFDEFHVTYENNTEGRQAHFFYTDKPAYEENGENHVQNQRYRTDVSQEESSLKAFSELKTDSETKATSFISEVEAAEKELKEQLKAEKIAKEKQDAADNAFKQGKNGILVESRYKDPTPGKSIWTSPKVKYSQQEAKEIVRGLLNLLPSGTTVSQFVPINKGEKFSVTFKLTDIRVSGAAATDTAEADTSIATVNYTQI